MLTWIQNYVNKKWIGYSLTKNHSITLIWFTSALVKFMYSCFTIYNQATVLIIKFIVSVVKSCGFHIFWKKIKVAWIFVAQQENTNFAKMYSSMSAQFFVQTWGSLILSKKWMGFKKILYSNETLTIQQQAKMLKCDAR